MLNPRYNLHLHLFLHLFQVQGRQVHGHRTLLLSEKRCPDTLGPQAGGSCRPMTRLARDHTQNLPTCPTFWTKKDAAGRFTDVTCCFARTCGQEGPKLSYCEVTLPNTTPGVGPFFPFRQDFFGQSIPVRLTDYIDQGFSPAISSRCQSSSQAFDVPVVFTQEDDAHIQHFLGLHGQDDPGLQEFLQPTPHFGHLAFKPGLQLLYLNFIVLPPRPVLFPTALPSTAYAPSGKAQTRYYAATLQLFPSEMKIRPKLLPNFNLNLEKIFPQTRTNCTRQVAERYITAVRYWDDSRWVGNGRSCAHATSTALCPTEKDAKQRYTPQGGLE